MRARKRSLTILLVGVLGTMILTSCSNSAQSLQAELESGGYSNVQIVDATGPSYVYSTVVNGCIIQLTLSQDKEVWMASIEATSDGETPSAQARLNGSDTFEGVSTVQKLQANQQFVALCP